MLDVDEVYKVPANSLNQHSIENQVKSHNTEVEKNESKKEDLTKPMVKLSIREDEALKNFTENLNLYKSGRFNIFERHVNQMFIRGDNVVTVTFAD